MSKSLKMIIEALLYAAEKPLSAKEIRTVLPDAKESEIKGALDVLRYEYQSLERSFTLKEVANGYQFRSRSEYAPYIMKMLQKSPSRLSKAAMETLAIIAYKQPILRHEIERFRGVDVGGILRTLLEKGLIKTEMGFDGLALFFRNGTCKPSAFSGFCSSDAFHLHDNLFYRATRNKLNERKTQQGDA